MSLPAPSSRSSTSAAQEAHPPQALAWHALSVADCLARLDVRLSEGLSAAEAGARSARDGPNVLPQAARNGPLKRFLLQFHNVLLYVLLGAGAITLLDGAISFFPNGSDRASACRPLTYEKKHR